MSSTKHKKKFDNHQTGIFIGVLAPIFVLAIVYLLRFIGKIPIQNFILKMYQISALPSLLSLCAIINLGIFFLFYKYWFNNAARGIIMATFLFAFIVIIMKINSF